MFEDGVELVTCQSVKGCENDNVTDQVRRWASQSLVVKALASSLKETSVAQVWQVMKPAPYSSGFSSVSSGQSFRLRVSGTGEGERASCGMVGWGGGRNGKQTDQAFS